MKQRLLVAAVGVPLLILVLVFLPPLATGLLAAAIAGAAAYELLHTAGRNVPPFVYILTVVTAALTVLFCARDRFLLPALYSAVYSASELDSSITFLYAAFAFLYVMALFLTAVCTHGLEKAMPFASVAVCIVAAFLFPAMYSAIARLRNIGPAFVLMPFVVAFIGDSFSMLGGMALGHKKFAPRVSPNKTWAGFLAGPVGSALGQPLGRLAPLGYLGEPLPCALGGLSRLLLELAEGLVDLGRVLHLEEQPVAALAGDDVVLDRRGAQLVGDDLLDRRVLGKPRELLEAELRVGRHAVGRDGLGAPAGDGPADSREALGELPRAALHCLGAGLLADPQHPVEQLAARLVPVVARHPAPPFQSR